LIEIGPHGTIANQNPLIQSLFDIGSHLLWTLIENQDSVNSGLESRAAELKDLDIPPDDTRYAIMPAVNCNEPFRNLQCGPKFRAFSRKRS
jgi:hypothetical protein